MNESEKTILVVDDVPVNRRTIQAHLSAQGYRVVEAATGADALARAKEAPELILLDIMLPDMDGIEVCRQLKADPATREIPVIFLSILDDMGTKTTGFEAGGVDYLDKPVDPREMLARLKTHITLREQQKRITLYSRELEKLLKERTRLLIHADRLATLGTFSAAVAHEINNPVSYIMGNAELIKYTWNIALPILETHLEEDESGHLAKSVGRLGHKLDLIVDGAERVARLVREFRAYSRQSEESHKGCRLVDVINDAVNLVTHRYKKGGRLDVEVPSDLKIHGDAQKISQVFVNLFSNAVDAAENQKGFATARAVREDGRIRIRVSDQGPGIDAEIADKIFEPYFTTKTKDVGTGLGLFIVRSILEAHQGEIRLVDAPGPGAHFDVFLPAI